MKVLSNKLVMLALVLLVIGAFVYFSGFHFAPGSAAADDKAEPCSGTENYCALYQQAINIEKAAWNPANYTRVRNSINAYKKQNLITADEASALQDLLALKYYNSLAKSAKEYCAKTSSLDMPKISTYLTELQLLPPKVSTVQIRTLLNNLRSAFTLPREVEQYVKTEIYTNTRTASLLNKANALQATEHLKENRTLVQGLAASKNWLNAFSQTSTSVSTALNNDNLDLSAETDDVLKNMSRVSANGSSFVNKMLYDELVKKRARQSESIIPVSSPDSTKKNEK